MMSSFRTNDSDVHMGSAISFLNCVSNDLEHIVGSSSTAVAIYGRVSGTERAIWYASVATNGLTELRLKSVLKKKKDPPNKLSLSEFSAKERAIADFPAPAGPWSQVTDTELSASLAQFERRRRKATRVPG